MTTKTAVNAMLKIIGSDGLSGIRVAAKSLVPALQLLEPVADESQLARVAAELRRQELIDISPSDGSLHLSLTVKGIHRLQRAQVEGVTVDRPETWDGLWRMVTYDVPRGQSAQRRLFTRQLERLGFTMVRESVWFHPYPCFSQIETIITYCGLQRYVTLAEITRIDNVSLARLRRAYPGLTT